MISPTAPKTIWVAVVGSPRFLGARVGTWRIVGWFCVVRLDLPGKLSDPRLGHWVSAGSRRARLHCDDGRNVLSPLARVFHNNGSH